MPIPIYINTIPTCNESCEQHREEDHTMPWVLRRGLARHSICIFLPRTKRIPRRIGRTILLQKKKTLADCAGTGPSTTYDIGAYCPINISALKKSLERKGHRYGQVERTTHKLIVIARDTLRLYEPSTLFDTHALMIKR